MSTHDWLVYGLGVVTGLELAGLVALVRWCLRLLKTLEHYEPQPTPKGDA